MSDTMHSLWDCSNGIFLISLQSGDVIQFAPPMEVEFFPISKWRSGDYNLLRIHEGTYPDQDKWIRLV